MKNRLVLLLLFAVAGYADTEVQKCIGPTGSVAYRDRPCSEDETPGEVRKEYVNELPMATPAEVEKVFAAIAREREAREKERIRRQNEVIRSFSRKFEEKQALCEQYKEDYAALLRFKRRNGNLVGDYESDVIRRMREACSS